MGTERARLVERLYEQALELPSEDRASFLEATCDDDAAARAEVESLLACQEEVPDYFLHVPDHQAGPWPLDSSEAPGLLVGRTVGGFLVQSVIGRGGMGTVYLAEQQHPRREVALKVMNRSLVARSALKRFEYESQILARLRHPSIAQVYEAGTHEDEEGSVPYFAMEYLPGAKTITEYARERGLNVRERLELFATVCSALHHGHQKGIIHRDVKPGNILVDEAGHVKIIDFGVARATDADVAVTSMQTDVGQMLGTLQYMSPEQCDADPHEIDVRSDVYSLGVVLYELLCEELPYNVTGTTILRAAKVICEQEPARPSTINRVLRGDLEVLVLKGLKKHPGQRYQSAADLARDIRHYLDGEPVEARPPTPWTRAHRWVVRHPAASTATLCLTLAAGIFAGTAASVWLANERPYRLRQVDDQEVELVARSRNRVHTWASSEAAGVEAVCPDLVDRPKALGGGRIALVMFRDAREYPSYQRSVCGFDVDQSLEEPAFVLRIEPGEALPDPHERGYRASNFCAQKAGVLEIFNENPGPEILVTHCVDNYSQVFIRLYDLGGNLLYQVWHDGTIGCFCWLPGPRLLVFVGKNSEVPLRDRGITNVESQSLIVVFAVRPALGRIEAAFLQTDGRSGPLAPAWYQRLEPDNAGDLVKRVFINRQGPYVGERDSAFALAIWLDEAASMVVGWDVDETGNEIEGSRVPSAEYKAALSEGRDVPDPDHFQLGPLPPIVLESEAAAESVKP